MCRLNDGRDRSGGAWAAVAALLVFVKLLAAAPAAGDEVAAYLERHGLQRLLAEHLYAQLDEADAERRDELIGRITDLYAELLETEQDAAVREVIERRGRELLDRAPPRTANALRLALRRSVYRTAQRTADQHRLRRATPEEVDAARASFAELLTRFDELIADIEQRIDVQDRQLSRAARSAAGEIAERLETSRALRRQAQFLLAWTYYYHAWLNDDDDDGAREAQLLFADVLDLEPGRALPQEVSVDLRSDEGVAQAILGMALAKSRTASSQIALEWLRLLEHPQTHESVRESVPAWRLAVLLEQGEYREAQRVFQDLAQRDEAVPVAWMRLAAVHALEAGLRETDAVALARQAMTMLASRGELAELLDIADRYGTEALGDEGFAARYVAGALQYNSARRAHGGDEPTADPQATAAYEAAVAHFRAALAAPNALQYGSAAATAQYHIAWTLYYLAQFGEARRAFEAAAEQMPPPEAVDAMWMAFVCLDRIARASNGNEAVQRELDALIDRFLEQYPSSEHAPKLVLRRAMLSGEASPDAVDALLAIPPESDMYDAARQQAARMLYRLFRESSGTPRAEYGDRYVSVALPLIADDRDRLEAGAEVDVPRLVALCRLVLEVALYEGVQRLTAARAALAALAFLEDSGAADLSEYRPELAYRRVRERLESGAVDEADALAESLWRDHADARWTDLASQAMFIHAANAWRDARRAGLDAREALERTIRFGDRVIAQRAADEQSAGDPRVLTEMAIVAEAKRLMYERSGDRATGREARQLYMQLLERRPNDTAALRAAALLDEAFGEEAQALERWRKLVAGTPSGDDAWFEAKFHVIDLLSRLDPPRARDVMDQHKALNPDYGPEPWRSRLEALDRRIAPPPPDDADAVDDEAGTDAAQDAPAAEGGP